MRLSYLEFLTSLKKYEFTGDARLIFRILDRDRTGVLNYFHFDPSGAVDLAQLKSWATTMFGGVCNAFQQIDAALDEKWPKRPGNLTLDEFREEAQQQGFISPESLCHVFEMLGLDHDRKVVPSELRFLDVWDCPSWLMVAPDFTGAQEFKRRLLAKYRGNAIVAWHFGLDQNNVFRVNWHEFAEIGKREQVLKEQLPGIWRALDTNLSGWLSLREFDPEVFKLLVDFKKYCAKRGGSIRQTLTILDKNENSKVSRKEMLPVIKDMGLEDWAADTLYVGLDLNGEGEVTPQKIAYLDKWNIEEGNQEEEFWQVVSDCLQAKHKSLG
jgi:hypothetical protein